jgi:CheY-like chemotaxis protein
VLVAADEPEALRQARACAPDVALIDNRLGAASGLEVCRALRAAPGLGALLLVLWSGGELGDTTRAEARALGVWQLLRKPNDLARLCALIRHRLGGAGPES